MVFKKLKRDNIARVCHWIRRFFQKGVCILLYHRVAEENSDPQLLCVKPYNFDRQMDYLSRHYRLITLKKLQENLVNGCIPDMAVVVTFDDGYADNLTNALPILLKYEIPATIFVATGYLGEDTRFPSDTLARLLLEAEVLPQSLELTISGKNYTWKINARKEYEGAWDVTKKYDPTLRHRCYRQLHSLLRPLDHNSRVDILTNLWRWAGNPQNIFSSPRPLNINELKILDKSSLIEIGAHGVNHLVLSRQPFDIQRSEIVTSKQFLEELLAHPVDSFAYPYGSKSDVSQETMDLVKKAGFKLACANFACLVTKNSDLFFLPRFIVRDWNDKEFAKRIKGVCSG